MNERRLQVRWTASAVADLTEIAAFIARESPRNAQSVIERLRSRATTLERAARRGRIVPELLHFGIRSYRELLVNPHRLIYRISEGTVFVMAVFDGRRDLQDVLLERILR